MICKSIIIRPVGPHSENAASWGLSGPAAKLQGVSGDLQRGLIYSDQQDYVS